jgi:hypothetical protein
MLLLTTCPKAYLKKNSHLNYISIFDENFILTAKVKKWNNNNNNNNLSRSCPNGKGTMVPSPCAYMLGFLKLGRVGSSTSF